jgi:hypothetical protein
MTMNTLEIVKYKWQSLSRIGKLLILMRVVRAYHNGDGLSFVWRYWNPIAYVFIALYIIIFILLDGISKITLSECLLTIDPFFKTHPDQFEWVDWKKRH